MSEPAPLATRLRRVDERRARLQTAMIGALNRRLAGGMRTRARLAPERDWRAASAWLRFSTRTATVSISPLLVDGSIAHLATGGGELDAAAAAALLGPIEPLVAAIETALGEELLPAGLAASVEGDPLLIRLDAGERPTRVETRLVVALPTGLDPAAIGGAPIDPAAVQGVRLFWTAAIAGPRLAASRLSALAVGDLLVLGIAPLIARLEWPGAGVELTGRVDPEQGKLIVQDEVVAPDGPDDTRAGNTDGPDETAGAPIAALPVALRFVIDGTGLSAGEVATLGEGSVLPLPNPGETLSVRILGGDVAIGTGELVAVGDGFGVVVTALDPAPAAVPTPAADR